VLTAVVAAAQLYDSTPGHDLTWQHPNDPFGSVLAWLWRTGQYDQATRTGNPSATPSPPCPPAAR
jgi:hypothetical protein